MVEAGQVGAAIILIPVGGVVILAFATALAGGDIVEVVNLLSEIVVPVIALAMLFFGVLTFISASYGQQR